LPWPIPWRQCLPPGTGRGALVSTAALVTVLVDNPGGNRETDEHRDEAGDQDAHHGRPAPSRQGHQRAGRPHGGQAGQPARRDAPGRPNAPGVVLRAVKWYIEGPQHAAAGLQCFLWTGPTPRRRVKRGGAVTPMVGRPTTGAVRGWRTCPDG